jgi:hypothetical protein
MNALVSSILASATGDGETVSSWVFYVVGGALAVWAVLVSLVAIRRPDFPSRGASRGIMLVSLLLVIGATSTAVITS